VHGAGRMIDGNGCTLRARDPGDICASLALMEVMSYEHWSRRVMRFRPDRPLWPREFSSGSLAA
jgi:hypothetical protein